jgi:hypothetical protein
MSAFRPGSYNGMDRDNNDCSCSMLRIPVTFADAFDYEAISGSLTLENLSGNFFRQNGLVGVSGPSWMGLAFTLYLVYLEIFVIKVLCPICTSSQLTMTLLFIITLIRLVHQPVPAKPGGKHAPYPLSLQ